MSEGQVVALILGLLSTGLGYLVYRASKKKDSISSATEATGLSITGLVQLNTALRADNDDLRTRLAKVDAIEADLRECLNRVAALERFIAAQGLTIPNGK